MSSEIAADETKNKEQCHTIVKKELETKELKTKELKTKELETNEYSLDDDQEEKKEESNITKMKNQKEMEEITQMDIWETLFVGDPFPGLDVLDLPTQAAKWKEMESVIKVRKVDDAVQTLLDHVKKGNKLKVANSFVSIFETLARKQHGLCVAKDEDNTSPVEVWIKHITVHVVV